MMAARCSTSSATATSCTRCDIPSCAPTDSMGSGRIDLGRDPWSRTRSKQGKLSRRERRCMGRSPGAIKKVTPLCHWLKLKARYSDSVPLKAAFVMENPSHARRASTIVNRTVTPRRRRNADLREREYLTPKEVERLQDAARKHSRYGHRDATAILIAYRHGLRASELCELTWNMIELDSGRIHRQEEARAIKSKRHAIDFIKKACLPETRTGRRTKLVLSGEHDLDCG